MNLKTKLYISAGAASVIILGVALALLFAKPQTQQSTNQAKGTYVSLGDSVAAGYGAGSISQYDYCERTDQAYPVVVASNLNLTLKSVACKSAQIDKGLINSQEAEGQQKQPQLEQLFAQPQPALITITAGVNDLDWTSVIGRCYSGVCGTADDTAQIESKTASMKDNLLKTLNQIDQHYGTTKPKVIVTGYYQFFNASPKAGCTDMSGVDQTETSWWRGQESKVNTAIQQAVSESNFAKFAPVNFDGHELCSDDSWVQSLQSSGVFHPTQTGQVQIANAVQKVYQSY